MTTAEQKLQELFHDRLGTKFNSTKPALEELKKEIEKLSRGRKKRPWYFYEICKQFVKYLEVVSK